MLLGMNSLSTDGRWKMSYFLMCICEKKYVSAHFLFQKVLWTYGYLKNLVIEYLLYSGVNDTLFCTLEKMPDFRNLEY